MPLWKIYHPEGAYSAEDKQQRLGSQRHVDGTGRGGVWLPRLARVLG